jgi:putative transposase
MRVAKNVLDQNFEVYAPDVAWVTDITYVWTAEGWLYLAAILDLFSRRVVGLAMSDHIDRALALEALRNAVGRRVPNAGLMHHSDRDPSNTPAVTTRTPSTSSASSAA